MRARLPALAVALATLWAAGCGRSTQPEPADLPVRPSILLVTLDTTRADAMGPEARDVATPVYNALASRGLRFRQAYATAPETLPSHSSMMTGLYPAGHGVRENARPLAAGHAVVAERLQKAGYRTAAFVSSFVLARRFGLARGFEVYDDELADGQVERSSIDTTERALAYLRRPSEQPLLLWVHYFDPHAPYAPGEPYSGQFPERPYLGEIAAMDAQLGRLVEAFDQHAAGPRAIIVAGDHGEGLGDHGELQHGNLLYQSTMHVPLVVVAPGVAPGVVDRAVSTRRIFHTVLDVAGLESADSLRGGSAEIVLGEAMRPFLSYGWQPQVMAVEGRQKAIYAGSLEVYDVAADPAESRNLADRAALPPEVRHALEDYPVPSLAAPRAPDNLSDDARKQLATLGYVSATAPPLVRPDAPRPVDMVHIFDELEEASNLFVQERYREAIPLLEQILAADEYNLDAALRLAPAHSSLRQNAQALAAFERARTIAPASADVRTYLALHYLRGREWQRAVPLLERTVRDTPDRWPAVEGLALVRERQGRLEDAIALRLRLYRARTASASELLHLGQLAMAAEQTEVAIDAFEKGRAALGSDFTHDLELGVLYLAARRLTEARDAFDRVPSSARGYPMALFKRAQVSVLLGEPDRQARIQRARQHADATTRALIAKEKLFQ